MPSSHPCTYWFPLSVKSGKIMVGRIDSGYDLVEDTMDLSVPCPFRDLANSLGIQPKIASDKFLKQYKDHFTRGLPQDHEREAKKLQEKIDHQYLNTHR